MTEQCLFWEAVESHFDDLWIPFMRKRLGGVWIGLLVCPWTKEYRVTHEGVDAYRGTNREEIEKALNDLQYEEEE